MNSKKWKFFLLGLCLLTSSLLYSQDSSDSYSELIVVSWNIQMLPNNFSFLSKFLRKKQNIRAPWIINHCINNNFDIIVFQEVFDLNIRRKLMKELKSSYPYQVMPFKGNKAFVSNGILIISKVPLKYIDHIIFKPGVTADKFAAKGCTLVEAQKDGSKIQIAGTHLQAGKSEKAQIQRDMQYSDIHRLLEQNKKQTVPVILLGDLNTKKSNSKDYSKMLETISMNDPTINKKKLYTFDSNNYWNNNASSSQLDYILIQCRKTDSKIVNTKILKPKFMFKENQIDLADHYAISAKIIFTNN
jgi:endonuclease/exonuclease/phosphatase family metal-dependent hydrolase|tara:strand:+ start:31979 stop:32881 length:903 start_codon:yes stop_codon:yes gene_type:complete